MAGKTVFEVWNIWIRREDEKRIHLLMEHESHTSYNTRDTYYNKANDFHVDSTQLCKYGRQATTKNLKAYLW